MVGCSTHKNYINTKVRIGWGPRSLSFLLRRQLEVSSRPRTRSQRAPPIMPRICWCFFGVKAKGVAMGFQAPPVSPSTARSGPGNPAVVAFGVCSASRGVAYRFQWDPAFCLFCVFFSFSFKGYSQLFNM